MELDDMRAFVEVIENGGFARAARRLDVAKSIVSRRIARLEADLGARLLNRNTRGVGPTEAGLELLGRAKQILSDVASAREAVALHRGEVAGLFRVSLPLSFGIRHMTAVLATLHEAHPRLEIDVSYDDSCVDLVAGRFDAAVRIGSLLDSTLISRHIAPVELMVVASPAYLGRHKAPRTPQGLSQHECLVYVGARERQTWRFRAGKQHFTVSPRGRFSSNTGEGLLQAAEAGLGIAALPDFIVADSVKSGRLVRLLRNFLLQEGAIHVVRPPGGAVPAKTRAFIDRMVEHFGSNREAIAV